jgi:hypothetical protein
VSSGEFPHVSPCLLNINNPVLDTVNTFNFLPTENSSYLPHTIALSDCGITKRPVALKPMSDTQISSIAFRPALVSQAGSGLSAGARTRKCTFGTFKQGKLYKLLKDIAISSLLSRFVSFCYPSRASAEHKQHSAQTHPQQNMIASGSIESDNSIRIWVESVGEPSSSRN